MSAGYTVVALLSSSLVAFETNDVVMYVPCAWFRLIARSDVEYARSFPVWNWNGTFTFAGSFAPKRRFECGTTIVKVASILSRSRVGGVTLSTRSVSVVRQPAPV